MHYISLVSKWKFGWLKNVCIFIFLREQIQLSRTLNNNARGENTLAAHISMYAYLKKSFLQYSFPSREKHFSVKLHLHSQHWTHLTCHALSKTLRRNRSRIGLSHPAQCTMTLDHLPLSLSLYLIRQQINSTGRTRIDCFVRLCGSLRIGVPRSTHSNQQSIRCHHGFLPARVTFPPGR